jgi:hypothetical protein
LAHVSSRPKEVTMENIPDTTSDMLGTFINVESAAKLIGNAHKILTEKELISKEFLTADDKLEKRNEISRYSTGSSNFDTLLTTHGHVNKKKVE